MTKIRFDWNTLVRKSIAVAAIGTVTSIGLGLVGFVGLVVDAENGNENMRDAVNNSRTAVMEPGRSATLIDHNTVQIQQGVLTQTFSFALLQVITTANFGNGNSVNENTPFAGFSNQPAIEQARQNGCTLARNTKNVMENYDFGLRTTRREERIQKETLETADLYLRNHCPPAP